MEIKLEDIQAWVEFRHKVNSTPLEDIVFTQNGEPIKIDPQNVKDFVYVGLTNMCFINTGFYIDGFEEYMKDV